MMTAPTAAAATSTMSPDAACPAVEREDIGIRSAVDRRKECADEPQA